MALARVQYVQQTAGNRNFTVPFPYISRDHVKVSVAGEPFLFTWLNSGTIQLINAPEVGAVVDVVRETARETLLVDFQDGSTVTEKQLDLSARQAFYLAQEAFDLTASTLAVANDGSYSASFRRITNLAYPQQDVDAANMQYVKDVLTSSKDAFEEANRATTARQGAEAARDTTLSYRNTADQHRLAAEAARDTALSHRNTADQHRLAAADSASASESSRQTSTEEANRSTEEANRSRNEADRAQGFANGLNLPSSSGHGGKMLLQKEDETGFEYKEAPYPKSGSDSKFAPLLNANFPVMPLVDGLSIVEAASMHDGGYIRFSAGVQVCWRYFSFGALNVGSGREWTWTFQRPFTSAPTVVPGSGVSTSSNYAAAAGIKIGFPSHASRDIGNSIRMSAYNSVTNVSGYGVYVIAIGFWSP